MQTRVYGYVRVSTQEQAKEGYSIGAQTERLTAYCQARGWTLCQIFTDPGYSGAKLERPALRQLIQAVEQGRADLVLVYKLDRLSRSQKDTLYLIEDVFLKNGTDFVSINENFDTSSAFGRAMIGILSVFAQLEREQIRERCEMGLAERAKEGLWHGGGKAAIGYDYAPGSGRLLVNEYEALQVREVFDLFVNRCCSLHAIARQMSDRGYTHKHGGWEHASTVRNVLTNNLYIGKIKWNGAIYEGKHPPIVEPALFDAAQRRISAPPQGAGPSPFAASSLLSGILFCGQCGARYYAAGAYRGSKKLPASQRRYIHIYTCYSRAKTKKSMIKDPSCKNANWPAEELDRYIMDEICKLDFNAFLPEATGTASIREEKGVVLRRRIASIRDQTAKLLDLYQFGEGSVQPVSQRLLALAEEEAALTRTLAQWESEQTPPPAPEGPAPSACDVGKVFSHGTLEQQRALVQALVKRIVIVGRTIHIQWNFQ